MALLHTAQLLFCVLLVLTFTVSLPVGNSLFSLQGNGLLQLSSSLSGRSGGTVGEPEKNFNLLTKSSEHLIEPGVNIQLYTRSTRDNLGPAGLLSELPRTERPKTKDALRQIPNGLYKKLNPVVELWHRITGKQEDEPYLGSYNSPSPAYQRAWEYVPNEDRKKLNIFQRFWNWVKSFFPCLKKEGGVDRIYGENGYWTNQKSKIKFNDIYVQGPIDANRRIDLEHWNL